ncbi:MAG: cupin domain-containing protein [Gaiellaceae bacterium]
MVNIHEPVFDEASDEPGFSHRRARLGEQASCRNLGVSLWELPPGQSTAFHYHVSTEEMMIVVRGKPTLRTGDGWRELREGELVAFPHGVDGLHQLQNRTDEPVRALLFSELAAPGVSVYPDSGQIGVWDAARRSELRFGFLFDVADTVAEFGGGRAAAFPPPGEHSGP